MPNAVIYCRVSSEEQAQKDISIPAQRKALERWVVEQGDYVQVGQFVDEGESAYAPADKRPGFCGMVSFCRKQKVDFILVHKLDRFSRNREESILFKSLLRKHGVTVKSITEHYDAETPQGFLYEGMIEVINQFYSMNLGTETLKGMRENAERGFHNGGRTPYGYRIVRTPDAGGREHGRLGLGPDEEVAVVREIFDMAAHRGMGGRTIANELNKRGIPGPCSRHWNTSTIKTLLGNPVYVGDVVWMKSKKSGRSGREPNGNGHIVVKDACPAIVSRDIWDAHRTAAIGRRFDARKNIEQPVHYLLGRLIRCGDCGSTFVGRRHTYKNRRGETTTALSYYCGGYLNKGTSVCRALQVDKDWIEEFVLGIIKKRMCEEDCWRELEGELTGRIAARRTKYGQDPRAAAQKVADIDRRIEHYFRAIGEGVDPQVCRQHIDELRAKKAAIEVESAVLLKEDYYTRALEQNLATLTRFRDAFAEGFDKLPFHVRRQIVVAVVESIEVVDRSEVRVRFQIPFENGEIDHLTDEMVAAVTRGGPALTQDCEAATDDGFVGRRGMEWLPLVDKARTAFELPSDDLKVQMQLAKKGLAGDVGRG